MRVGVFDSGLGGQSVANAIKAELPNLEVIVREDRQNLPYGDKSRTLLLHLVTPILQDMTEQGCEVIVMACNTVSTMIIDSLRTKISVPLVAVEPMIKSAVMHSKSGVIAVCATQGTLTSTRYATLKKLYAQNVEVLQPNCSSWAGMIETSQLNIRHVADSINVVLDQGADVIVLGCTHYHWIEHEIKVLCDDRAIVIQPEMATIIQLKRVLERLA